MGKSSCLIAHVALVPCSPFPPSEGVLRNWSGGGCRREGTIGNPREAAVEASRFISPGKYFRSGKVLLISEHIIPLQCLGWGFTNWSLLNPAVSEACEG